MLSIEWYINTTSQYPYVSVCGGVRYGTVRYGCLLLMLLWMRGSVLLRYSLVRGSVLQDRVGSKRGLVCVRGPVLYGCLLAAATANAGIGDAAVFVGTWIGACAGSGILKIRSKRTC